MFQAADFDITDGFNEFLKSAVENLPAVFSTIIILVLITLALKVILRRTEHYLINKTKCRAKSPGEYEKRVNTLTGVLNKFIYIIIWAAGLTIMVARLGMNIAPLVALAGVFGIAIGFGAQSLVQDIINGILILFENQVRVGDVAAINGTRGLVEAINWRTIILRDVQGAVHIFSNGSIKSLSNLTKEWSAFVFDIGVAYKEDVDNVISVIREVADGLEQDEEFGKKIIEPVEVFGLDKFDNSAIVVKGRIKTLPRQQRPVGREFNRRIKIAFDEKGITIPFPHLRIYTGPPSDPLEVLLKDEGSK